MANEQTIKHLLKTLTLTELLLSDLSKHQYNGTFKQALKSKANSFYKELDKETKGLIGAMYGEDNEHFFTEAQNKIEELVEITREKALEEIMCAEIEITE